MPYALSSYLTYASIGRPSPGVVGVWWVKLGARLKARGGHGIWAGHRYFTGQKSRLWEDRDMVLLIIHTRAWGSTNKQLLFKEMKTVNSKCLTWKEKWENRASFILTHYINFFSEMHDICLMATYLASKGRVWWPLIFTCKTKWWLTMNESETLSCTHM